MPGLSAEPWSEQPDFSGLGEQDGLAVGFAIKLDSGMRALRASEHDRGHRPAMRK